MVVWLLRRLAEPSMGCPFGGRWRLGTEVMKGEISVPFVPGGGFYLERQIQSYDKEEKPTLQLKLVVDDIMG